MSPGLQRTVNADTIINILLARRELALEPKTHSIPPRPAAIAQAPGLGGAGLLKLFIG